MADERPQYTTVAKTKNYWMSPQALNITLNARNEANRIAAGVASGARFFCHFKDIGDPQAEALFGYDVGHNFCSWPLIISPTYFYTDEVIYPHIAIPRIDRGNSQAMVVFPTKELDLWGYEVEEVPMQDEEGNYIDDDGNIVDAPEDAATAYVRVKLPGTETDADPVGSDEFYYIYLHGMLTEPFYSGGMLIRQWSPEIDTGRLNTDETWGEAVTLEELAREMKKKVDVDWFKRLFTIHGTNRTKPDEDDEDDDNQLYPGEISTGDSEGEDDEEWEGDDTPREVQPNDMEHEITDIEMMFGAWTEQFISALGKNDQGGSGGGMLYGLEVIGNTLMLVPDGPSMSVELPESGVSQSQVNTLIEDYLETNHYLNDLTGFYWWGRQFATGSDAIKGNIDDTGHINPEIGGFYEIGTEPDPNSVDPVLQQGKRYKAIHAEEVWIGGIQLKAENGGVHVVGRGLYADTYISALGHNDQGGGGGATIYGLDLNGRTLSLERDSTNTSVELPDPGLDANAVTSLVRNYLDVNHYINDLSQFTWWGNTFTNNTTAITGDISDTGHILPEYDSQYNLGSSSKKYSALYIDEIHIGGAVISWDANNRGIRITKGLYSDEWVSALGANDQGSSGGATIYGLNLNGTTLTLERDSSQTSVDLSSIIPTLSWANISGKPNSLQGYGITDGVSTSAFWWGQQINNGEVTGDITLDNGDELKWKVPGGSSMYSMIEMEYTNQREQFYLGKDALTFTCDTIVRGSTLTLEAGTTAATHSASLAADGVFTVEKLRIGTIVISHDTTHGGLHVESAGLYADNYLSALGANDQGGSGAALNHPLSDINSSLNSNPTFSDGILFYNNTWQYRSFSALLSIYKSTTLDGAYVNLTGSQTVSGTKKFATIYADTLYLGGNDTDCFLNRNSDNLILQNNRSAGTVILAGNAAEPTYRKLGSGSSYTDNLILHNGSLNTDGSNNLTGITVGGTTYNISNGGGGVSLNEPLSGINLSGLSAPTAGTMTGVTLVFTGSDNKWAYSVGKTVNAGAFSATGAMTAASGFVKSGYDDTSVLLAGGGTALLSSIGGTDEYVKIETLDPDAETTYYPWWSVSTGQATHGYINNGLKYVTQKVAQGSVVPHARLEIGNGVNQSVKKGILRLYYGVSKYADIMPGTLTSHYEYTLPDKGGTIALLSDIGSSVSSISLTSGGTSLTPSSGVITFPAAKTTDYGIIKVHQQYGQAAAVQALGTASNRNYGLQIDTNGKAFVNVPWENDNDDTKNTAGNETKDSTLLYLVGSTSKSSTSGSSNKTNVNSKCYVGTDNCLYSNGAKVLTSGSVFPISSRDAYNLNTIYDAGFYMIGDDSGGSHHSSNYPSGSGYGVLLSLPYRKASGNTYQDFAVQIYAPCGDDSSYPNGLFYRTSQSYAWNGWQRVVTANTEGKVGIGVNPDSTYRLYVSGSAVSGSQYTYGIKSTGLNLFSGSLTIGQSSVNTSNALYVNGTSYFSDTITLGNPTNVLASAKVKVQGAVATTGGCYHGSTEYDESDIRKKDVIEMIDNLDVEMIARAPLFRFTWKDKRDTIVHAGTSAQYWLGKFPEVVGGVEEDNLYLSYSQTAFSAVVVTARKVMTHEEEIAALQKRVDAVEKENEWLRTEIERLKAA